MEVPGSSLTYSEVDSISQLENEEYHFVGIDINSFKDHVSKKSIASTVQDNLTKRSKEIALKRPGAHVLKCCYEMMRRQDFLMGGKIKNEAGVHYSYVNPIVEMLCEFFGYKLVLEDSMNDRGNLVTTSQDSKADYVVYSLMKDDKGKEHAVSAVIIEAKHSESLDNFIGQALGYYCKAKECNNQSGIAMLFNEYNEQIEVIVFLFPYEKVDPKSQELGYCIQSLMLPTMTFTYDDIQSLANKPGSN